MGMGMGELVLYLFLLVLAIYLGVTLAALLGHSKIQMVLRYAHPTEDHKVQAIRKLEEFTLQKQMAEAVTSAMIQ